MTRERTVDPGALAKHPLILFERGSNTRKAVDEFLLREDVPSSIIMETENVEIIKSMVASNLGVTILPYAAIAPDMRSGRFAWSRLRGGRLYRERPQSPFSVPPAARYQLPTRVH